MARVDVVAVEAQWMPRGPGQFGLATGTALTIPDDVQAAVIQAEGGDVRYRDDGTAPDANTGMLLAAGASMFYVGDLSTLQFAGAGTLNVLYYGWED